MRKLTSFHNLEGLDITAAGLSSADVHKQRERFGRNLIVEEVANPWLDIAQDTLKDPMIWFLVATGVGFIWVNQIQEGLTLFAAILPLIFMDAILHWRTQNSTIALRGHLATHARVVRDAQERVIDSRDVVPGDLVVLTPGEDQFLSADGFFESAENVQIDESVLTGESLPIEKHAFDLQSLKPAPFEAVSLDTNHLGFAGTRLLTGRALFRVLATGPKTLYGEIVQSVTQVKHERTGLQIAIANLVRGLIVISGVICVALAVVRLLQGHGWLDALLSAATLAVAAIPEEFPVVFTFYLSVGVYRLAKQQALVRRAVSVENIGRVTRICSDKTGTITVGQLQLTHLDPDASLLEDDVLRAALSASDPSGVDPLDQAIVALAKDKEISGWHRVRVFPFTEDRRREAVIARGDQGQRRCFMKGSPETVLARCALSAQEADQWRMKTLKWASEGHKVIACAERPISDPEIAIDQEPESGFKFLGLLAFEDPARSGVREAMAECMMNGVGVLMITGDHPATARAIAKDVGLGGESPNVASAEENPERFELDWLRKNPEFLSGLDVVARCSPLQKLRIVTALKESGDCVAVTGDGVNDVPALKTADIGIAMGLRGARSAKEVSAIILSDDNFATIVKAIMEGRQLFANLKASFEYLLLFHIPFVLTAALVPFLGYPLLYMPVHVVWLELVIHPTALFAFQKKSRSDKWIPNHRRIGFFSRFEAGAMLLIGVGLSIAILYSFSEGVREELEMAHARAKVMALLFFWSSGLVALLTRLESPASRYVAVGTLLSGIGLIQLPVFANYLGVAALHMSDWLSVMLVAALFVGLWALVKRSAQTLH